jgi:glycosyltransferase involved in cell wall biosynthesis
VVAGEGDLLETLRNRCRQLAIDNKVDLRGYVPHEELPDLYRSAELFVQPSYYEGMSNTVLEAMASGLPIVATGEGGREELLKANAAMTTYGDPTALTGVLTRLLTDKQKSAFMGEQSRQIAETFSWAAVADRYLDLYRTAGQSRLAPRTSHHGS